MMKPQMRMANSSASGLSEGAVKNQLVMPEKSKGPTILFAGPLL